MKIHNEGIKIIFITVFILLTINTVLLFFLFHAYFVLSLLILVSSFILFLWVMFFFRNPVRRIIANTNEVVSPADGKVVVVEKTIDKEYFKDERIQISIFMSLFNVHVNRYPISGKVVYTKHHEGSYLVAWHPKSSEENERFTTVIKKDNQEILIRQIAGIMARRIISYSHKGKIVRQGEEMGIIRFGSRVDVFLPVNYKMCVKVGEKVKGNLSVLATK